MSGQYAPVRDMDAEEDVHHRRTPDFPQAEPYRGSTETLVPESTTPPGTQYARVPPGQAGNGRAHIRPTFTHQGSAGTGPYADPWSPGYQRKGRFSLGNAQELHAGDQSKRFSRSNLGPTPQHTSSTPPGPPVTKWQNFKNKFQGHRIRERGHEVPGLWASLKAIVTCSWLNVLFVFIPLAWYWGWRVAQPFVKEKKKSDYADYVYLFILSFIAIIPLENICEFAGEQLALYCGESIGDLIIITLHNVVEVVLAWFLLIKCELKLLQATIVGVVLLHALLVPGTAFLTGGSKIWAQNLKPRVTELNQSLLTIGVLALVVPAGFYSALPYRHPLEYAPQFANQTLVEQAKEAANKTATQAVRLLARADAEVKHKSSIHAMELASQVVAVSDSTRGMILALSRGISVILFVIYIGSRIYLHNPPGGKKRSTQFEEGEAIPMHDASYAMTPGQTPGNTPYFDQKHRSTTPPQTYSSSTNLVYREEDREKATALLEREQGDASHADGAHGHGHGHHKPEVGPWPALVLLLISVGMVTITAECLVIAIKPIREQVDEKKLFTDEWFGLVLLPLLSYAGDGLNAVMYFIRTSLFSQNVTPPEDLAKAKSIDLAIQFALLWVPLLVLVAWIVNTPLTLLFDHFEIVVIVGACFLVNSVTQDGRTNWAEGLIMVGFYVIIALAAWFYPGDADIHFLSYCKSVEELLSKSALAASE
ncbi:Vacuolar calcium ion transporter [Rhizoctonia solani]|uniref:Vacuolar calcium ion transporter n=1 Tax=Rhizoctonia solani TaxID=456999 RepID=A0A0K6GD56_9AGAM|nr:Vacuolar calcium ion transporter [Rhizoctonia solani]